MCLALRQVATTVAPLPMVVVAGLCQPWSGGTETVETFVIEGIP
jgi:hypothetical protein